MAIDADSTSVSGIWFRHVRHALGPADRAPFPGDNRWQPGDVVDALYFAQSEPAMWAEFCRHAAEKAVPPEKLLPRDMWTWEISLSRVADLRTAARLSRVELMVPRPSQSTWPDYQHAGQSLWRSGWQALVCPSACHADSLVLCVFRNRDGIPQGLTPIPPPRTVRSPLVPTGLRT